VLPGLIDAHAVRPNAPISCARRPPAPQYSVTCTLCAPMVVQTPLAYARLGGSCVHYVPMRAPICLCEHRDLQTPLASACAYLPMRA
jgi:hypothetical protein